MTGEHRSAGFYDYDKAPGSYEAPAGLIEGEIAAKWQYKVKNGKMVYASGKRYQDR